MTNTIWFSNIKSKYKTLDSIQTKRINQWVIKDLTLHPHTPYMLKRQLDIYIRQSNSKRTPYARSITKRA